MEGVAASLDQHRVAAVNLDSVCVGTVRGAITFSWSAFAAFLRDYAQRLPSCHDCLKHGRSAWVDAWWQLTAGVFGHWLIGHLAHDNGAIHREVRGAAVQGRNVRFTSLLTMGECWHNNHHAFPGSA